MAGIASAEPALLTFLIADVRGYTRFTVEQGNEAAALLATEFAHITREVVASAGGEVTELRGDEAEQLCAHAEAQRHFRNAAELATEIADRERAMNAWKQLADVLWTIGPFDEALRCYEEADRLALELDRREVQRQCIARAVRLLEFQQWSNDKISKRACELLGDRAPSPGLAELYLSKSEAAFWRGRHKESEAAAAMAGRIARQIDSDYWLATAEFRRGTVIARSNAAKGIKILESVAALAEKTGNVRTQVGSLNNLAFNYMLLGQMEKNLSYLLRAYRLGQEKRDPLSLAFVTAGISEACVYLGDMTKARDYAHIVEGYKNRFERVWFSSYLYLCLGRIRLMDGEFAEAEELLTQSLALAADFNDPQATFYAREVKRELCLLRGDPTTAVSTFRDLQPDKMGPIEMWSAAETYLEIDDTATAQRIMDHMAACGAMQQTEGTRIRGRLAAHQGDCVAAV